MSLRFVAMIRRGPNWQRGRSVYEQGPAIEGHLQMMRQRYDEGALLIGGPFLDGDGIALLEAVDEAQASAIMDADPGVAAGVLSYELHGLLAYFDAFGDVRTEATATELGRLREPSNRSQPSN